MEPARQHPQPEHQAASVAQRKLRLIEQLATLQDEGTLAALEHALAEAQTLAETGLPLQAWNQAAEEGLADVGAGSLVEHAAVMAWGDKYLSGTTDGKVDQNG